jgi:hypothetical protein
VLEAFITALTRALRWRVEREGDAGRRCHSPRIAAPAAPWALLILVMGFGVRGSIQKYCFFTRPIRDP